MTRWAAARREAALPLQAMRLANALATDPGAPGPPRPSAPDPAQHLCESPVDHAFVQIPCEGLLVRNEPRCSRQLTRADLARQESRGRDNASRRCVPQAQPRARCYHRILSLPPSASRGRRRADHASAKVSTVRVCTEGRVVPPPQSRPAVRPGPSVLRCDRRSRMFGIAGARTRRSPWPRAPCAGGRASHLAGKGTAHRPKYQRSPIIEEVLETATFADWGTVADGLIADARETLADTAAAPASPR
jgi:hypothetical protein